MDSRLSSQGRDERLRTGATDATDAAHEPQSAFDHGLIAPSKEDVDDILRKKRKQREPKACYPCRQRKVRCDSQVPCKTCVERNHAHLCTWYPPDKRQNVNGTAVSTSHTHHGTTTVDKDDWDRICSKLDHMERAFAEFKDDMRKLCTSNNAQNESSADALDRKILAETTGPKYVKAMEVNELSQMTGENIHLGGGSVPALIAALNKGKGNDLFGSSVLPLFGLDNESATYPFVSLWGQQGALQRVNELAKVLPGDAECLETFRQYRDGNYVTYPAVAAIERLESDLLQFLSNRRTAQQTGEHQNTGSSMHGMPIRWVALLFAAFAGGIQFSTMPGKDRDLLSQVYVCCSFECLRIVNYLANASLEVVQAMLVLGNVLSNGMNAGASWSFLGMTIRLAQSLGLHTMPDTRPLSEIDLMRSRTWWAVLWQDSLLSISYDRASSAATADCPFPPEESSQRGGITFAEAMRRFCKVGLDTVRNRLAPQSIENRLTRCVDLRKEIQRTQERAADHLRDLGSCRSIKDQSEYWIVYLHASYMTSELCRPAISPSTAEFDKSNHLRRVCIDNLMNTVDAFLGLANSSPIHTRSWAVTHRALSSALLLGILGEPLRNPRAQQLLPDLINVLRNMATLTNSELSPPIARSISALSKLSASESRTPKTVDDWQQGNQVSQADENKMSQQQIDEAALSMGFDEAGFFLPNPLSGFEDESSPYALMDSIIWGGGRQGP
ncbi:hypothetical protein FH972_023070 [Carpinus fangiana]|uniref:Zn(2)-C6 fungal-type domain-containing protein n=1 Tax=Carpinus fangiana TaxID=176857 RepID=A0A5N6KUQ2_9ROSI|nr:hypothetical protein FH972_023070 [Carpinus fangiana]